MLDRRTGPQFLHLSIARPVNQLQTLHASVALPTNRRTVSTHLLCILRTKVLNRLSSPAPRHFILKGKGLSLHCRQMRVHVRNKSNYSTKYESLLYLTNKEANKTKQQTATALSSPTELSRHRFIFASQSSLLSYKTSLLSFLIVHSRPVTRKNIMTPNKTNVVYTPFKSA